MQPESIMSLTNISDALRIYPIGNGIKLIHPKEIDSVYYLNSVSTKELCQQSFSVFFINAEYLLQRINDKCANTCGFDSPNSAFGKSAFDFATKSSAEFAIKLDKDTIFSKKTTIIEQTLTCLDGSCSDLLSIRSPIYNDKNKIMGLLGCSITLGVHPLADSLSQITHLGLLNIQNNINNIIGSEIDHVYLSKRQLSCAKLLLAGMTIKKIAAHLNLSHRTIETYVENMKIKLKCDNKTSLILKLSEHLLQKDN